MHLGHFVATDHHILWAPSVLPAVGF